MDLEIKGGTLLLSAGADLRASPCFGEAKITKINWKRLSVLHGRNKGRLSG